MYIRQAVILDIINKIGGRLSRVKLIKLLFLIAMQTNIGKYISFYDFLPYKYGPFSFTAYRELACLIDEGIICGDSLTIVDKNRPIVNENLERLNTVIIGLINEILSEFGRYTGSDLKKIVYSRYPWYASVSKNRAILSRPIARPGPAKIYTIGYEGKSIDLFLSMLMSGGVGGLIDVRNNSHSRKFGFSADELNGYCEKAGVEYYHFPEVGIPGRLRGNLDSNSSYEELFRLYREQILVKNHRTVDMICALSRKMNCALLCFESDPERCHRGQLSKIVSMRTGLEVFHI